MTESATVTVTTPSDTEVRIVRTFAAPKATVFRAWTTPDLVRQWLSGLPGWTMEVCDIDLREGGRLRYEWKGPEGEAMGLSGEYVEVAPPDRMVHTEVYDDDWTGGPSTVTTEFAEREGRTIVTMTIAYASREVRDQVVESGVVEGVGAGFDRLDGVLAGGT